MLQAGRLRAAFSARAFDAVGYCFPRFAVRLDCQRVPRRRFPRRECAKVRIGCANPAPALKAARIGYLPEPHPRPGRPCGPRQPTGCGVTGVECGAAVSSKRARSDVIIDAKLGVSEPVFWYTERWLASRCAGAGGLRGLGAVSYERHVLGKGSDNGHRQPATGQGADGSGGTRRRRRGIPEECFRGRALPQNVERPQGSESE